MSDDEKLRELASDFSSKKFAYDLGIYRTFIQKLLTLRHLARTKNAEEYFDLLEDIVTMIFNSFGGGTLSANERQEILDIVASNWQEDLPDIQRAAMAALVTALIPHPGAKEWLLATANSTRNRDQAIFLRRCADQDRDTFVI